MSDDVQTVAKKVVEGQTVVTTGTFVRPPSERPRGDTLDGIAQWLIGSARRIATPVQAVDEYAWRLHAAGLPVLRVSLHCGTLHPQFLGSAHVWWRSTGQTQEIMVMHEVVDVVPDERHYVYRLVGTADAEVRGYDPTGKSVREGFFGPSAETVLANYDRVVSTRAPYLDPRHYVATTGRYVTQETIFLPLSDDGENVNKILVYSASRQSIPGEHG